MTDFNPYTVNTSERGGNAQILNKKIIPDNKVKKLTSKINKFNLVSYKIITIL